MKKIFIPVLALLVCCGFFLSCKKDSTSSGVGNTTTTVFLSNTYWFGTASVGNEGQSFKSDGTTVQYDFFGVNTTDTATCPYKGYGKYTVKGDTLTFNVTYPTAGNESFVETAIVDTTLTPNVMTGSYSGSGSGSFQLTKQ